MYPMQKGQELLLNKSGSNYPICDSIPVFARENDAPIFGKLSNGD